MTVKEEQGRVKLLAEVSGRDWMGRGGHRASLHYGGCEYWAEDVGAGVLWVGGGGGSWDVRWVGGM